jgi:hypothetical protein
VSLTLGTAAGPQEIERWRGEGAWNSKIPDAYILTEKRVDWAFWVSNDRSHGPGMTAVIEAGHPMDDFVGFHLPHKVKFEMLEDRMFPDEWLGEHLSGAWQYWGDHMYFEHFQDAFHFKMVHYDGR